MDGRGRPSFMIPRFARWTGEGARRHIFVLLTEDGESAEFLNALFVPAVAGGVRKRSLEIREIIIPDIPGALVCGEGAEHDPVERALGDGDACREVGGLESAAGTEGGKVRELGDEKDLPRLAVVIGVEAEDHAVGAFDPSDAHLNLGDGMVRGGRESVGDPLREGLIGNVMSEDAGAGSAVVDVRSSAEVAVDGDETWGGFLRRMSAVDRFDVDEVASAIDGDNAVFGLGSSEGRQQNKAEKDCYVFHRISLGSVCVA